MFDSKVYTTYRIIYRTVICEELVGCRVASFICLTYFLELDLFFFLKKSNSNEFLVLVSGGNERQKLKRKMVGLEDVKSGVHQSDVQKG